MRWKLYLTRPFDLFGTTLWQGWYESRYIQETLGFKMDEVLCVEISPNLVSQYRTKAQLRLLQRRFRDLLYLQPDRMEQCLQRGARLGRKAKAYLKTGQKSFKDYRHALDFFNEAVFFTTVFPNFPSFALAEGEKLPPRIERLCAALRATSYYPPLMKKIIIPLARAEKVPLVGQGGGKKRFVYQKLKGKETITWTNDPQAIVQKIEGVPDQKQITGSCAYPGKVRGRAHVVLDFRNPRAMKKGQVLISINSNPTLMPLIKKASAIVADEGGITCHAAIVSREFKIPCIIGTKIATKVLREGDLVEVDADKGVVRKLR